MGRVAVWLHSLGVRFMRFRQHKKNEMAHYADDCWDAELMSSYGWIECVGIANRAAFDLREHSRACKMDMGAQMTFPTPTEKEVLDKKVNKGELNAKLRNAPKALAVASLLTELPDDAAASLAASLSSPGEAVLEGFQWEGDSVTVTQSMFEVKKVLKKITTEPYLPNIIEPSFGIGRIIYCVLEQTYWARAKSAEDKGVRTVLSLPPSISAYKVIILPLSSNANYHPLIARLRRRLTQSNLSAKIDESGTAVGRRYARWDEAGIPFALTLDPQTLEDQRVTIRERDSVTQIRLSLDEAPE
eukprot:334740_1